MNLAKMMIHINHRLNKMSASMNLVLTGMKMMIKCRWQFDCRKYKKAVQCASALNSCFWLGLPPWIDCKCDMSCRECIRSGSLHVWVWNNLRAYLSLRRAVASEFFQSLSCAHFTRLAFRAGQEFYYDNGFIYYSNYFYFSFLDLKDPPPCSPLFV